jgi:hypothetical protein
MTPYFSLPFINFAIKTRHKLSEIHNDVVHNGEKDI